jgi:Neuraminidase (sialidase)
MEAGAGLTSGQGSDPQIMLDWSDDGGRTWSNELWRSAGKIGEYRHRAIWNRLGRFRRRTLRIRKSDPVKASFLTAFADIR